MNFDLRTPDSAYEFILTFMNMTPDEYIMEKKVECENDFESFWKRNSKHIESIDISNFKIIAFHILGSLDECQEIKKNGIMNLQRVLSEETILSNLLKNNGIIFNIEEKTVNYNSKIYNIDYLYYREQGELLNEVKAFKRLSRRIFYDFCVNGFLVNDNVFRYGTDIHKRPEFFIELTNLFSSAKDLEQYWIKHSKSYRIDFFATINQIDRSSFYLDEIEDPPYDNWINLNDEMKIKKWMLSHAIDRAENNLSEAFLYIDNNTTIPPNQILSYTEIKEQS